MQVERLVVGTTETNCYLAFDSETREAIIIDSGAEPERILDAVADKELDVNYIVNTHGHLDHIAANQQVKEATGAELLIHEADAEALTNPRLNLSAQLGVGEIISPPADKKLAEGDVVEWGSLSLEVIHTPGHTPGGICLLGAEVLFTGDTLFAMGVGRTDFPQASAEKLKASLSKLRDLEGEFKVYPGHGPTSTLPKIKQKNRYL